MKKRLLFLLVLATSFVDTAGIWSMQKEEDIGISKGLQQKTPVKDERGVIFEKIDALHNKTTQEETFVTKELVSHVLDIRFDLPFKPTLTELEQIETIRDKNAELSPGAEIAGLHEKQTWRAKFFSWIFPSLLSESWGKKLWQFAADNVRDQQVASEIRERYLANKYREKLTLTGHTKGVECVEIAPNGNIVTGSYDNKAKIWDPNTGQCLHTLNGHIGSVWSIAIAPNGNIITGSGDYTAKIWDASTGQCLRTLAGHTGPVFGVAIAPNGNIVTGSGDHTAKIWDPNTGQCLHTLNGHTDSVRSIAIAPNGNIVTGSKDDTAKIWNPDTGQCLHTLTGHRKAVYSVAIAPNGNIVTGSWDNTAKIWEPWSKTPSTTMQAALVAKLFDLKDKNQTIRLHAEWQEVFDGLPDNVKNELRICIRA
ncbi:MAG: WD40 repeat domain-containing protein [bacterium]